MQRAIEYWIQINEAIACPGIRDWYWVSSEGRIYSSYSNRILSQPLDPDGYRVIGLYDIFSRQINFRVHRLVLQAFCFNPLAANYQVNHKNGVKSDNYIGNLEWTTPRENVIHAHETGLAHPRFGEDNPMALITNDQADYIARLLSEENLSIKEITEIVGCSKSIVESIKNGQCWIELYDKYGLANAHVPRYNEVFSYDQINFICQYLQDNNIKTLTKEVKLDILDKLSLDPTKGRLGTIYRIFSRQRFQSISNQYNF